MEAWIEWGIPVLEWLQGLGEWLLTPMQLFTFLGTENFILLVMPALLWCIDVSLGIQVGMLLLLSNSLNGILKMAVGWPRPYWITENIRALSTETSYGFPSGHAQNAVVLWGRLAVAVKRWWSHVLFIALILLISISRGYLGVHFPTDILVGGLVGLLLLGLWMRLNEPLSSWLEKQSFSARLLLAIALSLSILALGLGVATLTSGRAVPAEWSERAEVAAPQADPIDPQNLDGLISGSAAFFGFILGAVYLQRWGGFDARGSIPARLGRYLLGIIGVVALFFGLRALFPSGDTFLPQLLRFVRYALVGSWVSYGAPRLFVGLNLA
jgi:membrane-associated phospholipid phosphatase